MAFYYSDIDPDLLQTSGARSPRKKNQEAESGKRPPNRTRTIVIGIVAGLALIPLVPYLATGWGGHQAAKKWNEDHSFAMLDSNGDEITVEYSSWGNTGYEIEFTVNRYRDAEGVWYRHNTDSGTYTSDYAPSESHGYDYQPVSIQEDMQDVINRTIDKGGSRYYVVDDQQVPGYDLVEECTTRWPTPFGEPGEITEMSKVCNVGDEPGTVYTSPDQYYYPI